MKHCWIVGCVLVWLALSLVMTGQLGLSGHTCWAADRDDVVNIVYYGGRGQTLEDLRTQWERMAGDGQRPGAASDWRLDPAGQFKTPGGTQGITLKNSGGGQTARVFLCPLPNGPERFAFPGGCSMTQVGDAMQSAFADIQRFLGDVHIDYARFYSQSAAGYCYLAQQVSDPDAPNRERLDSFFTSLEGGRVGLFDSAYDVHPELVKLAQSTAPQNTLLRNILGLVDPKVAVSLNPRKQLDPGGQALLGFTDELSHEQDAPKRIAATQALYNIATDIAPCYSRVTDSKAHEALYESLTKADVRAELLMPKQVFTEYGKPGNKGDLSGKQSGVVPEFWVGPADGQNKHRWETVGSHGWPVLPEYLCLVLDRASGAQSGNQSRRESSRPPDSDDDGTEKKIPKPPDPRDGGGPGSLVSAAAQTIGNSELGGVDLSDISLVYIGSGKVRGKSAISYAFRAKRGSGADPIGGAQLSMAAFILGLRLPQHMFWVNLNPSEPDRVIDSELAETEVGRVLLEADLQMKKDFCRLTDPRNSEFGKRYWEEIQRAAGKADRKGAQIVTMNRCWIVPDQVRVRTAGEQVWVKEASLRVCLESEYFAAHGTDTAAGSSGSDKAAQRRCEQLAKELILPRLNELVNRGAGYRDLRQVFHGLILATCWNEQSAGGGRLDALAREVGLTELAVRGSWSPRSTFDAYVKSVREGEYDFTEESSKQQGNVIITHIVRYFSGGVDFTALKPHFVHESVDPQEVSYLGAALSSPWPVWRGDECLVGGVIAQ